MRQQSHRLIQIAVANVRDNAVIVSSPLLVSRVVSKNANILSLLPSLASAVLLAAQIQSAPILALVYDLSLSLYILMCVWTNLKKHCEKLILFLGEHRLVFRKINHPYWIIWTPIYYANKSFSLYWQCGRYW